MLTPSIPAHARVTPRALTQNTFLGISIWVAFKEKNKNPQMNLSNLLVSKPRKPFTVLLNLDSCLRSLYTNLISGTINLIEKLNKE